VDKERGSDILVEVDKERGSDIRQGWGV